MREFNAAIDLLPPPPPSIDDDPISRLAPSLPSTDRVLSIPAAARALHVPEIYWKRGVRVREAKAISYSRSISLAILISLFTAQPLMPLSSHGGGDNIGGD